MNRSPRMHEALAASLQVVFEEAAFHVLNGLHARDQAADSLCLAGGCAMNSVANGKIRERTPFKEVYIQPASGDNGTALGAAYWVWNQVLGQPRGFVMRTATGDRASTGADDRVRRSTERAADLAAQGCVRPHDRRRAESLCDWTAAQIADGQVDRLVSGAHGMGRAGAREPQHPGRPAARRHARDHQHARSNFARSSGRSRPPCWRRRIRTTSRGRCPTRS